MATATQSLLLDIQGEFPVDPEIRVQPTVQRSSPTAAVGWKYRRRYAIVNNADEPLVLYPYAIDLGLTNGLVSGSKAQSDADDLRVWFQGQEIARTLVDWNSGTFATLCWIVIPYLGAGASMAVDVVYGNSAATTPPTLTAGTDLPAFDIGVAGTNRSTNAKWVYLVDRVAANAGKGGWYLSTGTAQPEVRFGVPGAWRPANTLQTDDARWQESFSTYTDSGTKYQGRFEGRRGIPGGLLVGRDNGMDGVAIRNPIGISSVRADIRWINMAIGDTDVTPIGQAVILTRNAPNELWKTLYSNAALQATEATITTATYTPAAAVKEVAFAVWPYQGNNIDLAAKPDRYINAAWYSVLEVAPNSSSIAISNTEAEVEIYELAVELRHGGGGDAVGIPPYKSIFLGNARSASGVGTPRLACKLNEVVRVFTAERKVEIWNSGVTARVETAPIPAVSAVDGVLNDLGVTVEQASSDWMPMMPVVNPLTNPSFAVDAGGWTRSNVAGTVTVGAHARDTGVFDTTPASLVNAISGSTLGATARAFTELADDFLPVGNRQNVQVGVALRTSNVNLTVRPLIAWYDSAQGALSTSLAATWTMPSGSFRRRLFAASVPAGAVYYRVGAEVWSVTANQTGSLYIDSVEVNDTEIAILDVASGTLVVSAVWTPRYAYA